MLALIYVFSIWVVATTLFVAVNEIEPNPRLASAFKFLIVFASVAAVAGRLMPNRSGPVKGVWVDGFSAEFAQTHCAASGSEFWGSGTPRPRAEMVPPWANKRGTMTILFDHVLRSW
jgi:hypothetical protein